MERINEGRHSGIVPRVTRDCLKWRPLELEKPEADPQFSDLKMLERACEAIRIQTLRLEYELSPEGVLRAWLRLWLKLAFYMLIPGLVIVPLSLFTAFAVTVRTFAFSLLETAVALTLLVFLIRTAIALWRYWNEQERL